MKFVLLFFIFVINSPLVTDSKEDLKPNESVVVFFSERVVGLGMPNETPVVTPDLGPIYYSPFDNFLNYDYAALESI